MGEEGEKGGKEREERSGEAARNGRPTLWAALR